MPVQEFKQLLEEIVETKLQQHIATKNGDDLPELMSRQQVAKYWGVTDATVYNTEKDRANDFQRIDKPGAIRYHRDLVQKYKPV